MWKPIKDWEDRYAINETGEVINIRTNKKVIGDTNNAGYYRVCLYDKSSNRKQRYFRHRLVAMHFLENKEGLEEVNHIDGDKSNNAVSNLEWISRIDNERHSRRIIGNKEYKPYRVEFNNGTVKNFEFKSELAKSMGVTSATVKNWLHGRNRGYIAHNIKNIYYI